MLERHGLKARLDRDQLVYGLPSDIPNNAWKPTSTSWWKANEDYLESLDPEKTKSLPRDNQEPRYIGKTADMSDFSNDWFPNDMADQVSPARRTYTGYDSFWA